MLNKIASESIKNSNNRKFNFNINNDPLLTDLTTNSLIRNGKIETLFIDKNKRYINLYGAIIKKDDFHVNTKNSFLKRVPYLIDTKGLTLGYLKKLPKEYKINNYRKIRRLVCDYYLGNKLELQTMNKWIRTKRFPLPLLRILSYLLNEENILINALSKCSITAVSGSGKIKFPFAVKNFLTPFNFYIAGVVMGDGNINIERLKIADGDIHQKNLHYSYEFLLSIKQKSISIYGDINPSILKLKDKNAYELFICNKWFCRYLNFFFSIPMNKKQKLTIPLICNLTNNQSYYQKFIIRGLFDTDGSVDGYRVSFLSSFKQLTDDIKSYLDFNKIIFSQSKITDNNRVRFKISILTEQLRDFGDKIGFSHPKKKKILLCALSKNSRRKKLIGVNYNNLTNEGFDFGKFYNKKFSFAKFPKELEENLVKIAEYIRPVKDAGKIRFCNFKDEYIKKEITASFENLFNFKIHNDSRNSQYVYSRELELFFSNFFNYEYERSAMNKKEISKLQKNINSLLKVT